MKMAGVTVINLVCHKKSMTSMYREISFGGGDSVKLLGLTSLLYISLCSNVSL